jgi:hypothetical protein
LDEDPSRPAPGDLARPPPQVLDNPAIRTGASGLDLKTLFIIRDF